MTDELRDKLIKTAEYIIDTCAWETTSGNYIIYPGEIPADIISTNLYLEHIDSIAVIMRQYISVADVEVGSDGCIDTIMYLAYCPNLDPDTEGLDEYPGERIILYGDLFTKRSSRSIAEAHDLEDIGIKKTTLMERLEECKRRVERESKLSTTRKNKRLEI